jgi:dihydroorotate dehydrogenase
MGLSLPNRVGLAAGLDKNGAHVAAWDAMGFGFVEVGTVTPKAQPGNPKPRMFRLPEHQALINRMGFNNLGVDHFVDNVRKAREAGYAGILGLNIGKNAATPIERATDDYLTCLDAVYPWADYITINISSPNTKNLRALQESDALGAMLLAVQKRRASLARKTKREVPLALKIAPDLSQAQIHDVARALVSHGIDGVIATNTTVDRASVQGHRYASETGGLSGAPVREGSDQVIGWLREALPPGFPIIGVGGILHARDAIRKVECGASAVQLYTGLIYQGPGLVGQCARALRHAQRLASA